MFSRIQLSDFELLLAEEDISQPTEWRVGDESVTIDTISLSTWEVG